MTTLLRHLEALRTARLPGDRVPFCLGHTQIGWLKNDAAELLLALGCERVAGGISSEAGALPALAEAAARKSAFTWRSEAFDVRARPEGAVLATVDRGALPWLGIAAEGVHVNGLVRRADGLHLWVAQRAPGRLMDPGKLDHLFAGGVAAGDDPATTLLKEGAEEAGLSASVVGAALAAGTISYVTERPEGLRRDRLHCYDLLLPEDVRPVPADGEVAGFMLWPIARVIATLRETDMFKFNVALVVLDLLLRMDLLPADETALLRTAMADLQRPEATGHPQVAEPASR